MEEEDYYAILRLDRKGPLDATSVRKAYHTALLRYHPDKAPDVSRQAVISSASSFPSARQTAQPVIVPTVDFIARAYATLRDPVARAAYDRALVRAARDGRAGAGHQDEVGFTGLDTVDLDELEYDERKGEWRRGCRCEHSEAFIVREEDLEKVADRGELIVGCRGCSLWLKVLFQAVNGDGDEGGDEADKHGQRGCEGVT